MKRYHGYITKYALTIGIQEADVIASSTFDGFVVYRGRAQLRVGKDFFEDRDQAVEQAKEMARAKIVSLKRQLTRLEKLQHSPKWEGEIE